MASDKFYKFCVEYFQKTDKTGWGKNEIVLKLKDLYIEYLEREST